MDFNTQMYINYMNCKKATKFELQNKHPPNPNVINGMNKCGQYTSVCNLSTRVTITTLVSIKENRETFLSVLDIVTATLIQLSFLLNRTQTTPGPSQNMDYIALRCRATTCHECALLT